MDELFPTPIRSLPEANVPLDGSIAYISQGDGHQILFMRFAKEVLLPEHTHAGQWGIVLEGRIALTIGGETQVYGKGDRYYIPEGMPHSGRIFAGYADITFFNQADRYEAKRQGEHGHKESVEPGDPPDLG
jgi:mannose-6-phosphate isomerase-like protein (cupin superfamily)